MARTKAKATPAYRALADELRQALADGGYRGGRQLPTEFELAASHGLSRQTVRRAMQDLVAEGVIYRVPGRGTFPAGPDSRYLRRLDSVNDLLKLSIDTQLEVLEPLQRRADVDGASRLRLPSDSLYTLKFRRLHHGDPISFTITFLPPRIAELLADVDILKTRGATTTNTVIGLIEARQQGVLSSADQSITIGSLPDEASRAIDRIPGEPMLRIDRLYLDVHQVPVELAINFYNPDKYTYRTQLSRVRGNE